MAPYAGPYWWSYFLVAEVGGSTQTQYDHHELLNAFSAGHVTATSLVFRPDITGNAWMPLQSIPALTHELGIAYVPLPPPEGEQPGSADDWLYVDRRGGTVRAGAWDALQSARQRGDIDDNSIVWRAGMPAWKTLSEASNAPAPSASALASSTDPSDPAREERTDGRGEGEGEGAGADGGSAASAPRRRKKRKKPPSSAVNTSIYVTGLPPELSDTEAFDFFKKAGVIKEDVLTGERRIRLYQDEDGRRKGDGTVTYMFPASIQLALTLLDGAEIKPGFAVAVTEATFAPPSASSSSTASSQPASAAPPPPKKTKVQLVLAKRQRENALSWVGDDSSFSSPLPPNTAASTALGLRIVVLKRGFSRAEVEASDDADAFFAELCSDIGEELERTCGEVEKMTVYEESEEGVLIVKFKAVEAAERCMTAMKGRWYGGRQLLVEWFDGTDYSRKETEEEQKRRLDKFGEELEHGGTM